MRHGIPSRTPFSRRILAVHAPAAATALLLASFLGLPAQVLVRPVNLAYLVQRADIIVQGRVADVVEENLPGYPNIPTVRVTLEVEKMMRGPAGKTYTFREILLGLRSNDGKKGYRVGQQLFLFLPIPSKYGLSSPIGVEQGRFHISHDPAGGSMIVNESGNVGLFRDVAEAAGQAGYKLSPRQMEIITANGGPVNLDGFLSLIKSMSSMPRIR